MNLEGFFTLEAILLVTISGLSLFFAISRSLMKDFVILSTGLLAMTVPKVHIIWSGEVLTPWAELTVISGAIMVGFSLIRLSTKSLRELERAAFYDPLTGAYNRRFIIEYVHEEIRKAKRLKNEFAIILVDLNDFKKINDSYGHDAGDEALKLIHRSIRSLLREYDLIARWGGDEFLIVLPTGESLEILEVVKRLAVEFCLIYKDTKITLSVGYALFPDDGSSLEELLDIADERMYKAKRLHKEAMKNAVDSESKEEV